MSLAVAIDRTPWIDTHEHLVEERRRLGPDPYVVTGVWGERMCIPGDWTALHAHAPPAGHRSRPTGGAPERHRGQNTRRLRRRRRVVLRALRAPRGRGEARVGVLPPARLLRGPSPAPGGLRPHPAKRVGPPGSPRAGGLPARTLHRASDRARPARQAPPRPPRRHVAPNAVVDLCWAWSLAPRSTTDFVQRFLTTVPASKLLCFGGDPMVVETVVGHAELARRGLQAALEGLVRDDWLTPDDALALVPQLMRGNAHKIVG